MKVGDEIPFDTIANTLTHLGYSRMPVVSDKGEFAMRGGIVDLYPVGAKTPYRLDFSAMKSTPSAPSIQLRKPQVEKSLSSTSHLRMNTIFCSQSQVLPPFSTTLVKIPSSFSTISLLLRTKPSLCMTFLAQNPTRFKPFRVFTSVRQKPKALPLPRRNSGPCRRNARALRRKTSRRNFTPPV